MYRDKGLISGACSSNKCMVICTANYHCMYNKGERERQRQRQRQRQREREGGGGEKEDRERERERERERGRGGGEMQTLNKERQL